MQFYFSSTKKYSVVLFLTICVVSCTPVFWALHKKYTYYKDYSDAEKIKLLSKK
jgi:hypothetical protein